MSPRQNSLALAGIHATVLSILIGIFSTFAIYVQSNVKQLEFRVPKELNKIKDIYFPEVSPMEIIDIREPHIREKLINRITTLCKDKSQAELNNHEEEIFKSIYTLSKYSPFRKKWLLNSQDKVIQAYAIEPPPSTYIDMDSVYQWLHDYESLLILKDYQPQISKLKPKYLGFMEDYSETFFDNLAVLKDVYNSINYQMQQIKKYKSNLPQNRIMITAIIFAIVAFMSSVILPMFVVKVHVFFLLWIPTAFYFYIFSFIIYKII